MFAAGRCTFCGAETGSPELTPDTHRQRQLKAGTSRWPCNSVPAGHKRDSGNWAEWEWMGLNECTAEVRAGAALCSSSLPD